LKKPVIITISVIAILIVGALLYLKLRKSEDFEPLIKAKLQQVVKEASDSLYILNLDKIEIDVVGSTIKVHNAELLIDSIRLNELSAKGTAPVDVFKISVSDLHIDGFNVADLLDKKNINLNALNIKNPTVEVYHPVNKKDTIIKDTSTLYSRIQKSLGHFRLEDLSISNLKFIYHNIAEEKEKLTTFSNVSMRFGNIEIDSTTQFDTTRFLYAKQANIYIPGYTFRTPDSMYFLKADTLILHAAQKSIDVTGLSLQPRYSKQDFGKHLKFYKDRYDIKFKTASFNNIDWYKLFLGEGFTAKHATFNNGSMEVYADKNIPPSTKSKIGNFPHQLLARLDMPVDIDTILIKNFEFTYRELNIKTQQTGAVTWTDISGQLTNVTNVPEKIAVNKIVKVAAQSKLFNAGNFSAVFQFDMTKTKDGDFTLDINLGPMNGTVINTASKTLGLFEVNSLSIKKLNAHIIANSYRARSSVLFVYDDLNITALKKQDDTKKLKKKKLVSFFANTFIINKSNTMTEASPEYVTYQRDPQRSFFSLIWKSLLKGITNTAS
jgi:hypothetical protein